MSLVEGPPAFPGFAGAARQSWGRPFAALTYKPSAPCTNTAGASPSIPLRADWTNPTEG